MKNKVSILVIMVFLVLVCSGSISSAELQHPTTDITVINGEPMGEWILINGGNEAQWVITGWRVKVQNIGTTPVAHIKFRLKIWKAENNQMMYSQVHTIDIHLDPQDILTSQKFSLKEKIWYDDKNIIIYNKFGWGAEIMQVW